MSARENRYPPLSASQRDAILAAFAGFGVKRK